MLMTIEDKWCGFLHCVGTAERGTRLTVSHPIVHALNERIRARQRAGSEGGAARERKAFATETQTVVPSAQGHRRQQRPPHHPAKVGCSKSVISSERASNENHPGCPTVGHTLFNIPPLLPHSCTFSSSAQSDGAAKCCSNDYSSHLLVDHGDTRDNILAENLCDFPASVHLNCSLLSDSIQVRAVQKSGISVVVTPSVLQHAASRGANNELYQASARLVQSIKTLSCVHIPRHIPGHA